MYAAIFSGMSFINPQSLQDDQSRANHLSENHMHNTVLKVKGFTMFKNLLKTAPGDVFEMLVLVFLCMYNFNYCCTAVCVFYNRLIGIWKQLSSRCRLLTAL